MSEPLATHGCIVAVLATHANHYDAFRAWCQRCWSGVAHGAELRATTFTDEWAADSLLQAAVASGWLRKLKWAPSREQRLNIASSHRGGTLKNWERRSDIARAEEHTFEPDRESPAYCEFIAFIQLERCVFVPLVERWRQYAIATEKAELARGHADATARVAARAQELAEARMATVKRRAFLLRRAYQGHFREVGLLANACAAAVPSVTEGPVAAQLRWVVARTRGWFAGVLDDPAWTVADAKEMEA